MFDTLKTNTTSAMAIVSFQKLKLKKEEHEQIMLFKTNE